MIHRAQPVSGPRRVCVLGAGGTIAMTGSGEAVPDLDADALIAALPALAEDHEGSRRARWSTCRAPT